MIVLGSSMQGEDIIGHTNDKCDVFIFLMQHEDILEHINVKYLLCTL